MSRAVLALWYAAGEMQVPQERIPRIIVVHGCPKSAKVAALPALPAILPPDGAAALMKDDVSNGESVYFLWIIGKDSDTWLSQGMVSILAMELGTDPKAENKTVERVRRKLSATTSPQELRAGKDKKNDT